MIVNFVHGCNLIFICFSKFQSGIAEWIFIYNILLRVDIKNREG
jgi:hypothetical protein